MVQLIGVFHRIRNVIASHSLNDALDSKSRAGCSAQRFAERAVLSGGRDVGVAEDAR